MAIGNGELMHECFPVHLRMETARMKQGKETGEEGKMTSVSKEVNLPRKQLGCL